MFNMQTLYAICPEKGNVNYQINIKLSDITQDQSIRIKMPDGESKTVKNSNNLIQIDYLSGQGVWRFTADIIDTRDESRVFDSIIIDVAVIEECDDKIKKAVDDCIESMNQILKVGYLPQGGDARNEALALYKELRGAEIPEILRLLCFDRNATLTNYWRRLLLLKECMTRPEIKPFTVLILEIMSDLLCYERNESLSDMIYDIMIQVPIPPHQKWMYFLKVFTVIDANRRTSEVTRQLIRMTPPEYRHLLVRLAEELMATDSRYIPYVCDIYSHFNYREGIWKIISALELDLKQMDSVCNFLKNLNIRDKDIIEKFRYFLSMSESIMLIELLSIWKDTASIPKILEKVQLEFSYNLDTIMEYLKRFEDKSIIPQIEEIAGNSSEDKASRIRNALKSWG